MPTVRYTPAVGKLLFCTVWFFLTSAVNSPSGSESDKSLSFFISNNAISDVSIKTFGMVITAIPLFSVRLVCSVLMQCTSVCLFSNKLSFIFSLLHSYTVQIYSFLQIHNLFFLHKPDYDRTVHQVL